MRTFKTILAGILMFTVMLVAAVVTLRIALHGHEITIPDFAGMTAGEASDAALRAGLDLTIENKFYSTTVPSGRMLSQAPAPGSRVRHGWQVRVTQSLGPQQVTIPDVTGEPVREATMDLRRNSLDLGTVSHLEAPGEADLVLSQTPPPNAGLDQPRVSLLLSTAAAGASSAFVMPSFVGMTYSQANHAGMALGLRVYYIADQVAAPAPQVTTPAPGAALDATAAPVPVAPSSPGGPVTSQKPEAGSRVFKGETVRITFGHPASANPAPNPATTNPTGN